MSLEDIVSVTITSASRGITRAGFGKALVVAKHTNFAELYKEYSLGTALPDMITDGFTAYDPAYRAVAALARNTPKSQRVIVGKLLTAFTQQFKITVKTITAVGGELFSFDIISPDGTSTTVSYTAIAADTETVIAAALELQIEAIADLTSAAVAGVITVDADNSNEMFHVTGMDVTIMDFEETTADSNLATEITNIRGQNSDWYGLILADCPSKARITAVAAYVETIEAIFGATTPDTAVGDSTSTTDIAYTLNAAEYFRTYPIYSGNGGTYAAATWMGNAFPFDPGSQTWAFKALSGVTVDTLPTAFQAACDAKKCNYYVSIAGAGVTQKDGTMASGEYIDVIRGRDWLVARLRERIFSLLINARKVPYTEGGIDQVVNEVDAQLREGIGNGYLSPDNLEGYEVPFVVNAPDIGDISSTDKIARLLPDVDFTAGLAGAIHAVQINGVIQV